MRYSTIDITPVYRLHYTWSGWPTVGTIIPPESAMTHLVETWNNDGFTLLARIWKPDCLQFTFESRPDISPVLFAQRVKGRLQHELRKSGLSVTFSRKVAFRAIGENITDVVVNYVRNQLDHVDLADPRYREQLAGVAFEDLSVDLTTPAETNSGRYWYNLHLVLVTAARYRVGRPDILNGLVGTTKEILWKLGCTAKSVSVMPDHIHVAIRGNPEKSPAEIGMAVQEATAQVAGCRLWQDGFYIGTFSEYSLRGIRGGVPPLGEPSS